MGYSHPANLWTRVVAWVRHHKEEMNGIGRGGACTLEASMERKNTGVSCDRVTEKMWKAVEVLDYYTRRGSAWYIVREWLKWVVVERERDVCDVVRYHFDIASDHAYDYLNRASTRGVSENSRPLKTQDSSAWVCSLVPENRLYVEDWLVQACKPPQRAWHLSVVIERLMIDDGEVEVEAFHSLATMPWIAQ